MNIISHDHLGHTLIRDHGSEGARITHCLSESEHSSMVRIQLELEGVLGMHKATDDQIFNFVRGAGLAC